jgi:hypothetical protein
MQQNKPVNDEINEAIASPLIPGCISPWGP